jgi:hypothetical protein
MWDEEGAARRGGGPTGRGMGDCVAVGEALRAVGAGISTRFVIDSVSFMLGSEVNTGC